MTKKRHENLRAIMLINFLFLSSFFFLLKKVLKRIQIKVLYIYKIFEFLRTQITSLIYFPYQEKIKQNYLTPTTSILNGKI